MDGKAALLPDPQDGYLIRRQVEYYFSDENLPYDKYLLDRCHGPENLPVPVRCICEFKKMRQYKPLETVVAALKRSSVLTIIDDEYIQRTVPISEETINLANKTGAISGKAQGSGKKKKSGGGGNSSAPTAMSSGRPGMTKGMSKPTGFEEFYADAPVKPEDFEEERAIYISTSDFPARMEIAIQRYKSRRKFHQDSAHVFNRWLRFGGIDVGQKQFTGKVDQGFLDGYDAAEISLLTATHYVGDKDNTDEWKVDFEGVAKAFLSTQVPTLFFGYKESEIRACANVMRNFYNYLLHHDVCPEYRSDIEAARKICDVGERELLVIQRLGQLLPGQFNVAVSALSGGHHQFELQGNQPWEDDAEDVDLEEITNKFKSIIGIGIAGHEDEELLSSIKSQFDRKIVDGTCLKCVEESQVALEVVEIILSEAMMGEKRVEESLSTSNQFGKLICREWNMPTFETYDVPSSMKTEQQRFRKLQHKFLVDNKILDECFVGMKMEVTVRKLEEGGLEYLDSVQAIYCSFYTLLPNDLMMHWKEPEWVTSEKDVESAAAAEEASVKVY